MPVDMVTGKGLRYQMRRPYVSAHEGDPTADRIRAGVEAARERVRAGGCLASCPAAAVLGIATENGLTVRCGIERSLITERQDPSSLVSYCLAPASAPGGGHTACPSWQADKERVWAGRLSPLVSSREGV